MKSITKSAYAIASFVCGCSFASKVDIEPIAPFDLNRYLGRWYEIARFDHSFERGLSHVTATYSLGENGVVRVENAGLKNGVRKVAIGKAKFASPAKTDIGSLKVSFFGPFYAPYRIILLADDYSYALVTSGEKYLWVLSRTPTLPIPTIQKILDEAARRGFDTKKLKFISQV